MKKLNSTQKRLLIMLCAVLVMGGILLLLLLPEGSPENILSGSDINEPVGNENNDLLIYRSTDELEKLILTNPEGVFTISRDDAGELKIAELAGIPQNSDFIEFAWYDVLSVGYSESFTLPEDGLSTLADYGLESPQTVAQSFYRDGSTEEIRIGSNIQGDEDCFYFQVNDDPNIYVSSFEGSLFQGSKYWISDDLFTSGQSEGAEITRIECDFHDGAARTVVVPHTGKDKSDPFYSFDYLITAPEVCAPDKYAMTLLIDELSWFSAYEAEVVRPTAEDIAAYGLDKPCLTLDVTFGDEVHRVTLARYDYDCLYAMADEIPVIYRIDAESYPTVANLSPQTLRSTNVHTRYFDAIESFTVETADESYTFRVERVPMVDVSELYEYYAYCGDTQLGLSNYKALLEIFNGAAASTYSDGAEGEPVLTVRIKYFDSFNVPDEVITYTESGTRRYQCRINGSGTANVTSMWLDRFISAARTLASGEELTA